MPEETAVALELEEWIAEVEARGLIATIDDIAALPQDAPRLFVPIDFGRFIAHVGEEEVAAQHFTEFFAEHFCLFKRTGTLTARVELDQSGDAVVLAMVRGEWRHGSMGAEVNACMTAEVPSTRHAFTGSGDGSTRYVLLRRLLEADVPYLKWTPAA
jgi:hypothetical protein